MIDLQLVALCIVLVFAAGAFLRQKRRSLPPGPRGYPLIGNLFDLPREKEWLTYAEWGKKYGKPTTDRLTLTTALMTEIPHLVRGRPLPERVWQVHSRSQQRRSRYRPAR